MSKLINYNGKSLIYINENNGLNYKRLTGKDLTFTEEILMNSLGNYVGVLKLCHLDVFIFILKLDGTLDIAFDSSYDLDSTLQEIVDETKVNALKDIFHYGGYSIIHNSIFLLFTDNTLSFIAPNTNIDMHKMYDLHSHDDNKNVLCVDITHDSIQILKLDGTKIILTISDRTVIKDCPDPRLLAGSYI